MKKKESITIIAILATLLMIAGSIQAGPITADTSKPTQNTITVSYQLSPVNIETQNGVSTVHLTEATSFRNIQGEPILPIIMKTLEFPLGTRITNIQCTLGDTQQLQLTTQVSPAVGPVTDTADEQTTQQPVPDETIYSCDQFFPSDWYSYKLTGGLNEQNTLTTFLTIQINPVRYNPVAEVLESPASISLTVTYEQPLHPFTPLSDAYDMIIITYDPYAPLLEPLVTHKDAHGVHTLLVTMSDITEGTYFPPQGNTVQENIKYFIKNAKEAWNITYVMLVGNYKQVPVQYSYLETDTGARYEELKFASDLYYADIYDAAGNFSSWDTNDNGKCAEWPYPENHGPVDTVDLVPDVYVGRLACMVKAEVRIVVNKIISYETTTAGSDWFNTLIGIGGDTFEKSMEGGTDYNEGEVVTGEAMNIMSNFTGIKLWMSLNNLTTDSIKTQVDNGCGFLYFSGHGNPRKWATHPNGDYANWTGDFGNKNFYQLKNKDMYPILIVGGCHNSEVDVTPLNFIKGLLTERLKYFVSNETYLGEYYLSDWVPQCWSWVCVTVPRGGAIASIGSIGFGAVNIGDFDHNGIPDCVEGADGWLELEVFRLYHNDHVDFLGQAYGQAVANYAHNFPVDTNRYDAKVLETHILYGDPSLKIGGYE